MPPHTVSDSEFYMWRTLFALAFMDNVVSANEKELLKAYQSQALFSKRQLRVLHDDFMHPKDAVAMHSQITDPQDKARFCALARVLLWCDGDPERQEREILRRMSCMDNAPERDVLRESRNHPDLHAYYDRYAQAGMLGLMHPPGICEARA